MYSGGKKIPSEFLTSETPFFILGADQETFERCTRAFSAQSEEEEVLRKVFFHPKNRRLIEKKITSEIFKKSRGEYLVEKIDRKVLDPAMEFCFKDRIRTLDPIPEAIRKIDLEVVQKIAPVLLSDLYETERYHRHFQEPIPAAPLPSFISKKKLIINR